MNLFYPFSSFLTFGVTIPVITEYNSTEVFLMPDDSTNSLIHSSSCLLPVPLLPSKTLLSINIFGLIHLIYFFTVPKWYPEHYDKEISFNIYPIQQWGFFLPVHLVFSFHLETPSSAQPWDPS